MSTPRSAYPVRMPTELYERLRDAAELDMRSINAEIVYLLAEALDRRDSDAREDIEQYAASNTALSIAHEEAERAMYEASDQDWQNWREGDDYRNEGGSDE